MTALLAELGGSAPTGASVGVSQVEGIVDAGYVADSAHPEMTGKTFTLKSGATGASGHATNVGQNWYGTNGVAPGITQIDAYEAGNWLQPGFLQFGNSSLAPNVESRRIQNHSWIYTDPNQSVNEEILRRFDYAIQRDGFVAVVGVNNGNQNPLPALMAQSYNSISVGIPGGNHSAGLTTSDTAGRIKPEIVSPSLFNGVSYSCGVVSGAAALLLQKADATPALVNARTNPEVIKALLLAGAIKTPFPNWSRTPTQPIDLIFGAGQLNIQNSYHLIVAGEQAPSSSVTVSNRGWDFATTTAGANRYFFDVPSGFALTNFSVALTWNRKIVDSNPGPGLTMQVSVANLNLNLYSATNFAVGALVDSSVSTNQNIEHIYKTNLNAGRYVLEVTNDTTGTDYALAWGGGLQAVASIVTSANPTNWGSVTPSSGFYPMGSTQTFVATAAPYYLFDHWSGSLTVTNASVALTLTSNMSVTAVFTERFTTNHPTPYWWLAANGYTANQETVVTNMGANGFPLWQSYIAGLIPTNPTSQLRFTSQSLLQGTNLVLTWNSVTGRVYTIWTTTNVASGFNVLPGAVALPATVQAFTNPFAPNSSGQFYRLQVQKP